MAFQPSNNDLPNRNERKGDYSNYEKNWNERKDKKFNKNLSGFALDPAIKGGSGVICSISGIKSRAEIKCPKAEKNYHESDDIPKSEGKGDRDTG